MAGIMPEKEDDMLDTQYKAVFRKWIFQSTLGLIAYAAIQRCGGRLYPWGWLQLLRELRRTSWVNVNGAGMIEGYRGLGGTAILFSEMYKSVREGGFEHADLVQIGVENSNMQLELRGLGIEFHKTHRIYQRDL